MRRLLLASACLSLLASATVAQTVNGGPIQNVAKTAIPKGPAGGDLGGSYPNPTVVSVADVASGVLGAANGGTGVANTGHLSWPGALTFTGNTGLTFALPASSDTLAGLGTANVFTVNQSINESAGSLLSTGAQSVQQADGVASIFVVNASANQSEALLERTDGTYSLPTGLVSPNVIGSFFFGGYDGSALKAGSASISAQVTGTWAHSTNTETELLFKATPVGSNTIGTEATMQGGVWLGAATGSAEGVGTLNSTNLFVNGTNISAIYAPITVPLTDLAAQAANTVVGNFTSGSASPTAASVASCSAATSAVNYTTNTGFGCNSSITGSALTLTANSTYTDGNVVAKNDTPTCALAPSGTCTVTSHAGSEGLHLTLASAGSATTLTITPGYTATNGFYCPDARDTTTAGEKAVMTGNSTTVCTMTFKNDAGTATSPGASDVLWVVAFGQ